MKITIWIGGLAGALLLAGAASAQTCSPAGAALRCTLSSGATTCSVTPATNEFTAGDLLSAAQRCDPTIGEDTPVLVAAAGGSGGAGGTSGAFRGGSFGWGGAARMGTTIADLNTAYGSDAAYCWGAGDQASHSGEGGAGGASSILRTCTNISQTATTGVLLIAGNGGGGGAGGGV